VFLLFSVFYCVLLPFGVINDDDDDIVALGRRGKLFTRIFSHVP